MALSPGSCCLAHLADDERASVLEALTRGAALDARGVAFDATLLADLLKALPRGEDGELRLAEADFTGASFVKGASFGAVAFGEGVRFDEATFGPRASFAGATFADGASFRKTQFGQHADFSDAVFGSDASFGGARFGDSACFDRVRFGYRSSLIDASWGSDASFVDAVFDRRARFDRSVFEHRATFRNAQFAREASLRKMTFGVNASFEGASFAGESSFSGSEFAKAANFADATFAAGISFRRTTFGELATFRRVTFGDRAWFTDASFAPGVAFANSTFAGRTRFNRTTFGDRASFEAVRFAGQTSFEEAVFVGRASFRLATFERARSFGPVLAVETLSLDQGAFLAPARIEISAQRLFATGTRFPEGADLRVRWAEVVLDLADFGGPGILARSSPFKNLNETRLTDELRAEEARPRLVSMRGANVGELAVSGVDLSACRFAGAHNLDRLRLEGGSIFARSPRGTSRRQVIAEEQEWRAAPSRRGRWPRWRRRRWPRWSAPEFPVASDNVEKPEALTPNSIASIYRDLRRGRESNGDSPGAADFYYGEMEMRRHDPTLPRAERVTLWLYWLVSGYGLRSLRALAALLITIIVFAFLFRWSGFTPEIGFTHSLLFSAESTSNLFRTPEAPGTSLTQTGEALQIALRLLGPLFFGLALLSLRGRIRR